MSGYRNIVYRTYYHFNVTAEHFTLYQYSLVDALDHYIGFAQTETVCSDLQKIFTLADPRRSRTINPFRTHQHLLASSHFIMTLPSRVRSTWPGECTSSLHRTSSYLVYTFQSISSHTLLITRIGAGFYSFFRVRRLRLSLLLLLMFRSGLHPRLFAH